MTGIDKSALISAWKGAMQAGTFLTPKHDPANVTVTYAGFRSVLAPDAALSLEGFFASGDYGITAYRNANPIHGGMQYVVKPRGSGIVLGSGVPAGGTVTSGTMDVFVVVSGQQVGWHIYVDHSTGIQHQENQGGLLRVGTY
jgi:hypothetical protein